MDFPIIKEKINPLISIILPTRGRIDLLKILLNNITSTSDHNNNNYEIIIKVDSDDISSLEQIQEICKEKDNIYIIISSRRKGYVNLINFLEDMTYLSHGKYILALADDAQILTQNWNTILEKYLTNFKFYFPKTIWLNDLQIAENCWVIYPKEIINILQGLGPHSLIDSWFFEIGTRMNHPVWSENLIEIIEEIQIGISPSKNEEQTYKDKMVTSKSLYRTSLHHMNSHEFFNACNSIKEYLERSKWEKIYKHNIINNYKNNLES
jgi:hypothetical protein